MKQQHTPGPWKCSQHLGHPAWSVHMDAGDRGRGSTIVDGVAGIDLEQRLANARLIAAAPDLLEALQYMLEVCPAIDKQGEEAHQLANAAIAKATGEQQ